MSPISVTASEQNVGVNVSGGQGPQGPAATIAVGTVTTGAPGSSAAVVNAGASGAAVLNFTIPAGATGEAGAAGATGPQGLQGDPGVVSATAPITYASQTVGISVGSGLATSSGSLVVSYGTTAGTACQGNDARLSDAREWSAATATQAEAEAGTSTSRLAFSPLRVFQAIAAWWAGSSAKTKLDGIASGATANATDAQLRDRSTHTGEQAASTITGLATVATSGAYSDLTGTPSTFSPTAHKTSHQSGGSDELALAASQITSGTIATARLGSGTASASTYLRGDQTYSGLPFASTSTSGIAQLATVAESLTGTNTAKIVTPEGMNLSRRGTGRTKFVEWFTDFGFSFSGQQASDGLLLPTNVSGAGAGADCNTAPFRATDFPGRPSAGILSLRTGTTSTGRAGFDSWSTSELVRFDIGTATYETLIYLPELATVAEDYVFRIGYFKSTGIGNDVIGFEYDRAANANWRGVTGYNGSFSRVDTGVAVEGAKWILLLMTWTSALATFRVNASNGVTLATNIRPDGGGFLGGHILKTAGTTSRAALVDYVYYRIDFTNDRTFS